MKSFLALISLLSVLVSSQAQPQPEVLAWSLLASETQRPLSFTQGFELNHGSWYVSSGGYGRSFIARVDADPAQKIIRRKLPPNWFAEGLTLFEDQLYLLSWKRQQGLILDPKTLKPLKKIHYHGEGWGLSHNDKELIMSNGTNQLAFYQPNTFTLLRQLTVTSPSTGRHWDKLNELEFFKGLIWANIWQSNQVIAIDPVTGVVQYSLDFSELVPEQFKQHPNNVLNGLAWDNRRQALWLSGKFWPQRYLVRLPELD